MKLLRTKENKIWLEQFDLISKNKAFFYTGENSIHRPIIHRVHNRLLKRYKPSESLIVFPENNKPYSSHYSKEIKEIRKKSNFSIIVDSHLGPVPIELDEMYPYAQSVFPEFIDNETENVISKLFNDFTKNKNIICWKGIKTLKDLKGSKNQKINYDLLRISAVCDMQFGLGSSSALLNGDIKIIKSEKTGKIRNVYCDKKHILSMRASDGLFTLKLEGGKILHKKMKKPMLRVIVDKDAASFVKQGKSVFAKFVKECDPGLRPFDECIIVDEKDDFLAVGRCILNRLEMLSFDHGMAVKIREYIK
jgi:7-cyano-7-deazaguanine tRNA-ribosyltransferase